MQEARIAVGILCRITAHSLRYGGATANTIFKRCTPDEAQARGHW